MGRNFRGFCVSLETVRATASVGNRWAICVGWPNFHKRSSHKAIFLGWGRKGMLMTEWEQCFFIVASVQKEKRRQQNRQKCMCNNKTPAGVTEQAFEHPQRACSFFFFFFLSREPTCPDNWNYFIRNHHKNHEWK